MHKFSNFLFLALLIISSATMLQSQDSRSNLKAFVISSKATSDSVITIPPATSETVLKGQNSVAATDAVDLPSWLTEQEALNGLQSINSTPWHIVVSYDQFDEDGDNVHSGVYEEYWVNPNKYERIYKSDNFNQTDYATDKGLYRSGDQQWPDHTQSYVRDEIVDPFFYAASLDGVHARNINRSFSGEQFPCVAIENNMAYSDPTQYCFEPGSSILRYVRGDFWHQTVYNQIVSFQGRNVGREVDVTDGGKPYLKLRIETMESLPEVNEAQLLPPADAIGPFGERVSGLNLGPTKMNGIPSWPASLGDQHFRVIVEILIGKDGHVVSAHGISGPAVAYKACEDWIQKMLFKPYFVLGRPVEVDEQIGCEKN